VGRALDLHRHEVTVRFLEKPVVSTAVRGLHDPGRPFGCAFKESCCLLPSCGSGCLLVNKCPTATSSKPRRLKTRGGSPRTKTFPAPTSDTRSVAERELETLPKGSV